MYLSSHYCKSTVPILHCVGVLLQSGLTALMMASQEGKAKVVHTLLKAGAKTDLKDQV